MGWSCNYDCYFYGDYCINNNLLFFFVGVNDIRFLVKEWVFGVIFFIKVVKVYCFDSFFEIGIGVLIDEFREYDFVIVGS